VSYYRHVFSGYRPRPVSPIALDPPEDEPSAEDLEEAELERAELRAENEELDADYYDGPCPEGEPFD